MDYLAAVLFIGFYVPALWISGWFGAKRGWNTLAATWRTTTPPRGSSLPWISGTIGAQHFKSGLNVRFDSSGLWLRPILIYGFHHPPLLIPWADVSGIADESGLLTERVRIVLKTSSTEIRIAGYGCKQVLEAHRRMRSTGARGKSSTQKG
jgi:hypothetical protein